MSELPENTIEVWFDGGTSRLLPTGEVWLKVGTIIGTDGVVCLADLVALLNLPKPARAEVSVRSRVGVAPTWEYVLGPVLDAEDGPWQVYVERGIGKTWRRYKVVSRRPEGVPAKANYELSSDHKRVALGKAHQLMKEHRPELFKKFEEWVTTHKTR